VLICAVHLQGDAPAKALVRPDLVAQREIGSDLLDADRRRILDRVGQGRRRDVGKGVRRAPEGPLPRRRHVFMTCRFGGSGPYASPLASWPTRCRPAISAYCRGAVASTRPTNESQVTARCSQAASECPPSSGVPFAEPGVTWKHPSARSRSSQSGQLSRSSSPRRRMSARSPMSSRRPQ